MSNKKVNSKMLKDLIKEVLEESQADSIIKNIKMLLSPQYLDVFAGGSEEERQRGMDFFAQELSKNPQKVAELSRPSFMHKLYKTVKSDVLGEISPDQLGSSLKNSELSYEEIKQKIEDFLSRVNFAGNYISKAIKYSSSAKFPKGTFQKAVKSFFIRDVYKGIDSAYGTNLSDKYGKKNLNYKILFKDLRTLSGISSEDNQPNDISGDDLFLALVGGEDSLDSLSYFMKSFGGYLPQDLEDDIASLKSYRKKYIDKREIGPFGPNLNSGEMDVAIDTPDADFSRVKQFSSKFDDLITNIISNLVRKYAGISSSEQDTLKPINEDVNEFEIEDMEQFFIDTNKKSRDERELKAKIKRFLTMAPRWVDQNVPEDMPAIKDYIKSKIVDSVEDIKADPNPQVKNDWDNPEFDSATRADLSKSYTPDFNLADLYNIGGSAGKRLQNTFSKLTTLEGSSIFERIKTLESFLPASGGTSSTAPTLGAGKMSNFLAGSSISKLLVDYFGSGINTEIGYDFENFLSMLLAGERTGASAPNAPAATTMGALDVAFLDPEVGSREGVSAKSVSYSPSGRLVFGQAMSNINAELSTLGSVPYLVALKDNKDFTVPDTTSIDVKFYAFELIVKSGATITNNSSNQSSNIVLRPYKQQHTGLGATAKSGGGRWGSGMWKISQSSTSYSIEVDVDNITPFAHISVPKKEQFQTNVKAQMDSFNTDLSNIFNSMKKLKSNVEDFLMGEDTDESLAKGMEAVDTYIALQALINKTFFMKDQDLQLQDPTITDRSDKIGRVGVRGDLERVTNESLITANFLKKLIQETLKK